MSESTEGEGYEDPVEAQPIGEQVAQTPLDEVDRQKVLVLFNLEDAGYEGFAIPMLENVGIDVSNLSKDSAPFWESPEAAFAELTNNLTQEQLRVIEADCIEPAIVVEPITAHATIYVRDTQENGYDRRKVGTTPFRISPWFATYLDRVESRDGAEKTGEAQRIVGWRIGIADKARALKILATDGEVRTRPLEDRVRDFHQKGHGRFGLKSLVDCPGAYGLVMGRSRQGGGAEVIDDVCSGGTWTMGTQLDEKSEQYPFVAGGDWYRSDGRAALAGIPADVPSIEARIRLALMFNKV